MLGLQNIEQLHCGLLGPYTHPAFCQLAELRLKGSRCLAVPMSVLLLAKKRLPEQHDNILRDKGRRSMRPDPFFIFF